MMRRTHEAIEQAAAVPPCRDPQYNPDDWFIGEDFASLNQKPSAKKLAVKARCTQQCPSGVYQACAELALREGIPLGIYGGLDGRDRRYIWKTDTRQYPEGRPQAFDRLMDSLLPQTVSFGFKEEGQAS